LKAKKSFGQHFLKDENKASRIAGSLDFATEGSRVLEIGPGKGMLTKYLLEKAYDLKVIEADRDMVEYLEKHYPQLKDRIIFLDFLKINARKVFDGQPFYLIGNYPYNISSQIVFKMIKYRDLIPEMVGMFQKEMADRIVADPGSKTYGVISVLTQAWYKGKLLFNVAPGSFSPPPKVNSAVIRLTRKENFKLECNEKLFKSVVKVSFNQRRKMLRNTLRPMLKDTEVLKDEFFNQRPEQLSVDDFVKLTNLLDKDIRDEFREQSNGRPENGHESEGPGSFEGIKSY
jgi:16S rRNA (adenine1518-N6/adenine1519-N6)-dimethyltransferase